MKDIVILGGGFAGTTLAHHLERRLPDGWRLTLLSQENCITYHPLLAEVVGASILPGHVVAPIRQMLKRTRFRMVKVTDIDLESREIHYLGEGTGIIHYDHLVLACGVTAHLDLVPGMARHALPLKTLGDALFLRNQVIVRLEQAELQDNAEARCWLTTYIVVGGGFSGVEVAGELSDLFHNARRYYPSLHPMDAKVVLVHNGERLLPELSPQLSAFALKKMRERGIDVRLSARAVRVDDQGVTLDSGDKLYGGTVICTIGTAPNPLIQDLPLPKERGRVKTAPDMSVPGHAGLWALGDCAAIVNAHDGKLSPPTAQFATREAKQLADNIARSLKHEPTRPFAFRPLGALSSIGYHRAVADIFGLHLSGFIAWLLWRGVYLLKIPTLARKVRLYFEWNWQMLFPADIVHFGFVRSRRTPQPKPAVQPAQGQPTVTRVPEAAVPQSVSVEQRG
jgi:NADH dehydrogenase